MDTTLAVGLLLYGGSLFLLGILVSLWLTFGPTLWWDESRKELVTRQDDDEEISLDRMYD